MCKNKLKTCATCRFEPEWVLQSSVAKENNYARRGRCRFTATKQELHKLRLPQGCSIANPWIAEDAMKQNCNAWTEKKED